jgi:hypothetical protein
LKTQNRKNVGLGWHPILNPLGIKTHESTIEAIWLHHMKKTGIFLKEYMYAIVVTET